MKSRVEFFYGNRPVSIEFGKGHFYLPTDTVLYYLRKELNVRATREGCGVGDCGACTVVLAEFVQGKFYYYAVNSCLLMLPSLDGKWLITANSLTQIQREYTAGDGDDLSSLHPVQRELLKFYGVQCGFCTSGMLMSMFAIYKNHKTPSRKIIEEKMAGNLCRCTGYRPIVDACISACTGEADAFTAMEPKVREWMQSLGKEDFMTKGYYTPATLQDALRFYNKGCVVVCGTSDTLVKIKKQGVVPSSIMDLSRVKELLDVKIEDEVVTIGAAVPVERVRGIIQESHPNLSVALGRFASHQIRNVASLAGNIASPSPIGDGVSMLMAYDAVVNIAKEDNGSIAYRSIAMENFVQGYKKSVLFDNEIIISTTIPVLQKGCLVRCYKLSKRHSVDISTVNLSVRLKFEDSVVCDVKLFYGGMAEMVKRGVCAERYLKGKKMDLSMIKDACDVLENDFSPISDARATAGARMQMAKNLLELFLREMIGIEWGNIGI